MKNNKYLKLLKTTLIFGIGSVGSKLILFFMVPLYTAYLSTDEYGMTELIYTFMQLVVPFVSVVIYDAVLRFGISKKYNPNNVLLIGLLVVFFGSLLTIAITPLFSLYKSISGWEWYLCGYIILNMVLSTLMNYLKMVDKNILYSILSILQTLVLAVLNVVFLVNLNLGVAGYMMSTLIAEGVTIAASLIFGGIIPALLKGKFEKELLKEMLKYSLPLIFNNLSWWVVHSSDKLMIENMISISALGIYTVASKIPSLINVITSIFQQAWTLSSAKEFEEDNETKFYASVHDGLVFLTFFAAILIILVLEPFMKIYTSSDSYSSASLYIPLLLLAAVFSTLTSFWGSIYTALKKTVNSMVTTIIIASINLIVNFVLILQIGIWGAVIGTVVAYFVSVIIRTIDCRRYIKININFISLIINTVILTVQCVLVACGLNIYLISSICLLIFLITNYKVFLKIFKKVFKKKVAVQ